jgi:hypothetical protein
MNNLFLQRLHCKIVLIALFILPSFLSAVNYSGSYNVGTAGTWTNLTNAFTAISAGTVTGNINLVLVTGYPAAAETYPIVPSTNNGSYTITINPGNAGLSITSGSATGTLNFNGCSNYVLDGRVNQAGAMNLILANTNVAGYALQLINDATYNTIQYVSVQGISTSTSVGVISFSTPSATGNSNNTITNCDIRDGASTPLITISSNGTVGMENSSNTVANCNIYNFYSPTNNYGATGIDLETGNTDWTIIGNSFYQTSARVPTAGGNALLPIYISNTGVNYSVTGNFIGGMAPSCGGAPLSYDAAGSQISYFFGINVSAASTSACFVQNNTIANITFGANWNSGSANALNFIGIAATGGYVDVSNNTIGATTGNGSIICNYNTASPQTFNMEGIFTLAVQGNVSNNNIGSFTITGGKTNRGGNMRAIECDGVLTADFIINNNVIGSITTANSFQYSSATATPISIIGLFMGTSGATFNLTTQSNTFQNITNTATHANAQTIGIYNGCSSLSTITTNTIANLSVAAPSTARMYGIYDVSTTAGQSISNNVIHDLTDSYNAGTATDNCGIFYSGTTGANSISANNIYNLTLSSTNTASSIYGIYLFSGLATTSNNIIDLGNGITTGYSINGIYSASATNGANNVYANSVYIGGVVAAAGTNTNAFYSTGSTVARTRTIENNIFYNARTGGTAKHFGIDITTATGITSNYNDLYSSIAANLGTYDNGTTARTFAAWKAGVGDANSINADPLFTSPTAATPDLHIPNASPCSNIGLNLIGSGITVDFDNDVRSTTPDIGADEVHTNYYSKVAGNLELTTTWGLNTDGSGANPPDFATKNCSFNIRNNPSPTIGAAWAVTGSGCIINLGDGTIACNFTIPGAFSCTGSMNINNNGTLTNQNATNPTLNVVNAGSTVNYNAASGTNQTVATATYGNLILSNSTGAGATTKTLGSSISIAGNLTVNGYATFDMVTFNANRTGGGGTLSVAANSTLKLSGTTGGASLPNNFPVNFSTMTLATTSTVEYYGASAQNIYASPTYGNLTLTSGTKTAAAGLTIVGNLTINAGATFTPAAFTHNLKGNFLNYGTFTSTAATTMNFNGTAAQTIGPVPASGGIVTTFPTLKINNAAGVTLLQDANVKTTLTLTSGLLSTTTNTAVAGLLIMQSGSTAPALTAASTSYVNGYMQQQVVTAANGSATVNFPIGNNTGSSDCRPLTLTVSHKLVTQYNYNARCVNGDAGSLALNMDATTDTISGVHYWYIDRLTAANVPDANTNLNGNQTVRIYFGTNDFVYVGTQVTIVKSNLAGTDWINIGGTCSFLTNNAAPQAGNIVSTSAPNAFTSFSSFTLGSLLTQKNTLPIELVSFNAAMNDKNKVDLKWTTKTETNNKYFTVERSSDGQHFTPLMNVNSKAPHGNSTLKLDYQTTDNNPLNGTSYYRLRQTDYNGANKSFNIVSVSAGNQNGVTFIVYPNPNQGQFTVDFSGVENNHEVQLLMHDVNGKQVYSNTFYSQDIINTVNIIPEEKIGKGIYICSLIVEGVKYTVKVVVN